MHTPRKKKSSCHKITAASGSKSISEITLAAIPNPGLRIRTQQIKYPEMKRVTDRLAALEDEYRSLKKDFGGLKTRLQEVEGTQKLVKTES